MIKSTNGGNFNFADQILKIQKEMNPKPFDLSQITSLYDTYQQGRKDIYEAQKNQYNLRETAQKENINEIKKRQQQAELDKKKLELEVLRVKLNKLLNGGTGKDTSKNQTDSMVRGRSGGMQPQTNAMEMPSQTAGQSSARSDVNPVTQEAQPLNTNHIVSATPGNSSYNVNKSALNRSAVPVSYQGVVSPVSALSSTAGQGVNGNNGALSYPTQTPPSEGSVMGTDDSIENFLLTGSWQPSYNAQQQVGVTMPVMTRVGNAMQTQSPAASQTYLTSQSGGGVNYAALMNGYNTGSRLNTPTGSSEINMRLANSAVYPQMNTVSPYANTTLGTNYLSNSMRDASSSSNVNQGYKNLSSYGLKDGESYGGRPLGSTYSNSLNSADQENTSTLASILKKLWSSL